MSYLETRPSLTILIGAVLIGLLLLMQTLPKYMMQDTTLNLMELQPMSDVDKVGQEKTREGDFQKRIVTTPTLTVTPSLSLAYATLERYNKMQGDNTSSKVNPLDYTTIKHWYQAAALISWQLQTVTYKCKKVIAFGNWDVCQNKAYLVKPPCLVYSFGIAFDFTFDDAMGKIGCKVLSFDPSMKTRDHVRNENVSFYNTGIGPYNTNSWRPPIFGRYVKDHQIWKVRTLKRLMEELGHQNRVIDVLKLDIECNEWAVLDNIQESGMLKYIRQLLVEFHLFPTRPEKAEYVCYVQMLGHLRELGMEPYLLGAVGEKLANDYHLQRNVNYVNIRFNESGVL